jgi:glycosyltransferase involved in cell wall biosynthesis
VLLYPGGFQTHQGLDIAIRAFALFARQIPQAALHLYGEGSEEPALRTLVGQFGLKERVLFKGIVPIAQMPQIIADADVGIVAKRGDSFGGEAYSTKILEYMSQGLPCLVSRTPIDTFYFNDDVVLFFRSGDAEDMADKMLRLARDGQLRARLAANGRAYFERNNWEVKKDAYLNVVNRLLARGQE